MFWRMTPGEVTAVIRADIGRRNEAVDRAIASGWFSAALRRQKRIPRLSRLLRRRRRPRPAVTAPDEVSPERQAAIAHLTKGLRISPTDPYARGGDHEDEEAADARQ